MKRALLAAALLAAPALALAQAPASTPSAAVPAPDVPQHPCTQTPRMPGELLLREGDARRKFERQMAEYKECMMKYVEERKAVIKANQDAANNAINEYNATVKKIMDEQAERRGEGSGQPRMQ